MQQIILISSDWAMTMTEATMMCMCLLLLQLSITFFVFMCCVGNGNARITSAFVRSEFPSVDIPLDNKVFAVPKGYNAPQQVSIQLFENNKSSITQTYVKGVHSFLFLMHSQWPKSKKHHLYVFSLPSISLTLPLSYIYIEKFQVGSFFYLATL